MSDQTLNITLGKEGPSTIVTLQSKDFPSEQGANVPAICHMCIAISSLFQQVKQPDGKIHGSALAVKFTCDQRLNQGTQLRMEALQNHSTDTVNLTRELQLKALEMARGNGVNCVNAARRNLTVT